MIGRLGSLLAAAPKFRFPAMGASPQTFSTHGSYLPHRREIRERERGNPRQKTQSLQSNPLCDIHHFCMLLVTRTNPGAMWEGTSQGVNTRRWGLWCLLRVWLPQEGAEHKEVHKWRNLDYNHMPLTCQLTSLNLGFHLYKMRVIEFPGSAMSVAAQ